MYLKTVLLVFMVMLAVACTEQQAQAETAVKETAAVADKMATEGHQATQVAEAKPAAPAVPQQRTIGDVQEGLHYTTLSKPVKTSVGPRQIEVAEMFWYGCPHCDRLEPDLLNWLKTKPADAEYVGYPAVLNPGWEVHARLFYAAESLGLLEQTHQATFDAIHRQGRPLKSAGSIERFVDSLGLDGKAVAAAMKSPEVGAKIEQSRQVAAQYNISSVPNMMVDGKYMVKTDNIRTYADYFAIVDFLVAKARKEK